MFAEYQYTWVKDLFVVATTPNLVATRHQALRECARLDIEIARLRSVAAKEMQVLRQVALNLELKRAEADRAAALARL